MPPANTIAMWNTLVHKAYKSGADYFYLLHDDTRLASKGMLCSFYSFLIVLLLFGVCFVCLLVSDYFAGLMNQRAKIIALHIFLTRLTCCVCVCFGDRLGAAAY